MPEQDVAHALVAEAPRGHDGGVAVHAGDVVPVAVAGRLSSEV